MSNWNNSSLDLIQGRWLQERKYQFFYFLYTCTVQSDEGVFVRKIEYIAMKSDLEWLSQINYKKTFVFWLRLKGFSHWYLLFLLSQPKRRSHQKWYLILTFSGWTKSHLRIRTLIKSCHCSLFSLIQIVIIANMRSNTWTDTIMILRKRQFTW